MESTQSIFVKALENDKYSEATQLYLAKWQKRNKADEREENVYKGFVNAAATFDLIMKGKYKTAKKVWRIYEKYRPLINEDMEHYRYLQKADKILLRLKRKYKKVFDTEKYK